MPNNFDREAVPARLRLLLALLLCVPALASAQVTLDLVSTGHPGGTANGDSSPLAHLPRSQVSDDGRFVVYGSIGANLVSGVVDSNFREDVFVFDRNAATSQLISQRSGSPSATGNGSSVPVAISGDGRWVAYHSVATNLGVGVTDDNAAADTFLYDRLNGKTELVSHSAAAATITANAYSYPIALSSDGRWLLYYSGASNLVAGVTDTNSDVDMFLYDREAGTSRLLSHRSNSATIAVGSSHRFAHLSPDGRWAAFTTPSNNVVTGVVDTNNSNDVFIYDRDTNSTMLASRAAGSTNVTTNSMSDAGALSADGRWLLYQSRATNIVAGQADTNSNPDVFLFDRDSGTTTLVSRAAGAAATTGNGRTDAGVTISADGRWSLYYSTSTNLISGASIAGENAYLFDRTSGVTTLVSSAGTPTNPATLGLDKLLSMSADGRYVVWNTNLPVLAGVTEGNFKDDVYLYDRVSGTNALISNAANTPLTTGNDESKPVAISSNGNVIVYYSAATNLVAGVQDSNRNDDLFVRDRASGVAELVSRVGSTRQTTANDLAQAGALSADGRWVLLNSAATNVVAGQVNRPLGTGDVFLHDSATDANILISHAANSSTTTANAQSGGVALSADGRFALFTSGATNLVNGIVDNNNGASDAYLYDRNGAQTVLLSHAAGAPTTTANSEASGRALSADGRWVLYDTQATNVIAGLTDTLFTSDVFLIDRVSGVRTLVSHAPSAPTTSSGGNSRSIAMSPDGRYVLYLRTGQGQVHGGAYLYDRVNATTVLASGTAGSAVTTMTFVDDLVLSDDGQTVVFSSGGVDTSAGINDNNNGDDVYLFDARLGTVTLVSRSATTASSTANGSSRPKALSADGQRVLYWSSAIDLVAGAAFQGGVYVYDHATGLSRHVAHAAGAPSLPANSISMPSDISPDGTRVLFRSQATNLIAGGSDANDDYDVFLYDLAESASTLISRSTTSATTTGNSGSDDSQFSADGNTALFLSGAADLDPDVADGNQHQDLYLATLPSDAPLFADGFE